MKVHGMMRKATDQSYITFTHAWPDSARGLAGLYRKGFQTCTLSNGPGEGTASVSCRQSMQSEKERRHGHGQRSGRRQRSDGSICGIVDGFGGAIRRRWRQGI